MNPHDMITYSATIKIVDTPDEAPDYNKLPVMPVMLKLTDVIIVGKGTQAGAPTVDLQLIDQAGNRYVAMATGAIMQMIGGAVAGKHQRDNENQERLNGN